jgi:hypothetical protein
VDDYEVRRVEVATFDFLQALEVDQSSSPAWIRLWSISISSVIEQ